MFANSGVGLAFDESVYISLPESSAVGHPNSQYRPSLLDAAIRNLERVRDEARRNGYDEPSATAIVNAEKLLLTLFARMPREYDVYAGPGGDVAIETEGNRDSVLVLCEHSGSVLVMTYLDADHADTKYASIEQVPNERLVSAIQAIV